MNVKFYLQELSDIYVIQNFRRLNDFFVAVKLLNARFEFFEISIPKTVTDYNFTHNLGFQPKDILQTSIIGPGSLTWNYEKFTKDFLSLTATGPCVVRAFVGSYKEEGV